MYWQGVWFVLRTLLVRKFFVHCLYACFFSRACMYKIFPLCTHIFLFTVCSNALNCKSMLITSRHTSPCNTTQLLRANHKSTSQAELKTSHTHPHCIDGCVPTSFHVCATGYGRRKFVEMSSWHFACHTPWLTGTSVHGFKTDHDRRKREKGLSCIACRTHCYRAHHCLCLLNRVWRNTSVKRDSALLHAALIDTVPTIARAFYHAHHRPCLLPCLPLFTSL
jgi:hypothetical protein